MSIYYEFDENKLKRKFESCKKCGPGFFIGKHKDRSVCGFCGHTEFKGKSKRGRKRRK